jgi:hypothetical protein
VATTGPPLREIAVGSVLRLLAGRHLEFYGARSRTFAVAGVVEP